MPSGRGRRGLGCGIAILFAASLSLPATAPAQDYPNKDIHALIGFAAGSGADILGRFFTAKLAAKLGRTVIVDNKPGAIGNIAAEAAARAKPDGYTILIAAGSASFAANVHLFKKLPFDPIKDFTPVTTLASLPFLLVVSPQSPAKSVRELTALLKQKAGKAFYGQSNTTGLASAELYKRIAGFEATRVAYKVTADAMNELLAGQTDFMFMDAVFGLEQARSGKLRALAVTSGERSSLAPELPSMIEGGVPGFDLTAWWGVYLPAGAPQPIVDRLAELCVAANSDPKVKEVLSTFVLEPALGFKETNALYQRELPTWIESAQALGLEPV